MELKDLQEHSLFLFEDYTTMNPHKVIKQKGEMTFCETPSGKRQYYKCTEKVIGCAHCPHCIGCGCPTCSGVGFLLFY